MVRKPVMNITFWGVRGSVPAPLTARQIREKQIALIERIIKDGGTKKIFGAASANEAIEEYLKSLPPSLSGTYGGDTTCVEVQVADAPLILIDAGTGIRHLGREIMRRLIAREHVNPLCCDERTKHDIHLFFTHFHWDHLQGFPFFAPGFLAGNNRMNVHFYGKKTTQQRLADVLSGQQECPNFPVAWDDMPCDRFAHELHRLDRETLHVGAATITYQELTHPDAVFAYAIEAAGHKFTFATDTEHKSVPDSRLINIAKGSTVLYYDAQYAPEDYVGTKGSVTGNTPKFDWGHSTYEWGVRTALEASVPILILGHHEPARDDFQLEELLVRAQAYSRKMLSLPENKGKQLTVKLAQDGHQEILA
ncbi:MAG: MBL fold metallo-hydrolase [Candidatus Riflebacteria bacterium]|nr:MBL fold metallo-hydrolase [Candidatus Riflebacteria bacterium]